MSKSHIRFDATTCVLLIVSLAAALNVAHCFVVIMTPDLLPLWAAVIVGLLMGFAMSFGLSGIEHMEFVNPTVILILTFILLPVFSRAKEIRLRLKQHPMSRQIQAPTKTP